jgi:hypothetical protein
MKNVPVLVACLLGLAVVASLVLSSARAQEQEKEAKEAAAPVRHVVIFKFKEEATPEDITKIEQAFAALPEKIEGITEFEWGVNSSPEELSDGFTHCFLVTLASPAARDAYLIHEAHEEFVKLLRPHLEKAFVVDYIPKK